jgi:hypothetical protein
MLKNIEGGTSLVKERMNVREGHLPSKEYKREWSGYRKNQREGHSPTREHRV